MINTHTHFTRNNELCLSKHFVASQNERRPFRSIDLSLTGKSYFQDDVKEPEPQEDDPWAGLPYTVDLETGKLICDIFVLSLSVYTCVRVCVPSLIFI